LKDILDNKLELGDHVVCTTSKYEELTVGTIVKFTPTACRIRPTSCDETFRGNLKQSCQIMRIEEDIAILYRLKNG